MKLERAVFVWGENESLPNQPAPPPTVSVSAWPYLFDQVWQRWDTRKAENMPDVVRGADVAFVNLFHTPDSLHIQQIRELNPECYIIAAPDPTLDMVLTNPGWTNMWRQMALADAIGGRTHADCEVYGTLLRKKVEYLPSPIGPTDWFAQFRTDTKGKEDYLLTLDHAFTVPNTACNIATVAEIQRVYGMRVIYAAHRDHTPELAEMAGLKAEFVGRVPFEEFVKLTGKAALCVDMYASHSFGRQQVLCGLLGTPIIGSNYCADAPGRKMDIYRPADALIKVQQILQDGALANVEVRQTMTATELEFGFEASQRRMQRACRHRVYA